MVEDTGRFEDLFEAIKGGDGRELRQACEKVLLGWRDVPVEPLLGLKDQFHRLELEDRESCLDEALVSIAEKRPAPFTQIVTEPAHPLWRPAVEVLSLVGDMHYLELFLSLLPLCPRKNLPFLIRGIGRYDSPKVVPALAPFLASDGEGIFFEVLLAMRRIGGVEALRCLREGCMLKRREGSEMAAVLENVVREMEGSPGDQAGVNP